MKILIISDAWQPQINGVVRTYENLIPELTRIGHEVKVIGPTDFPHHFDCPGYDEIQLTPFPSRKLKSLIDEYRPDTIHIAVEGPLGWAARKICLAENLPFTTCYHTHFPDYLAVRMKSPFEFLASPLSRLSFKVLSAFHNAAQCTFVVSDTLSQQLRDNGFTGHFEIMTRGINNEIFHGGEKNLFADLPRPIALYVGRVAPEKNIESFLSTKWEGSKVIVGDGPARTELQKKYPDAHFLGSKKGKDLGDCYRSADLFVFPSKTDTFGMVNIEAMACGLPIAAYPVLGPIDIVTTPELGCLDNDLELAMKKAISGSGTPEFRQNHAKKMYSWEKAAAGFLSGIPNYG
jgi:glycosyltransferase involved in cell wall biosynthesis